MLKSGSVFAKCGLIEKLIQFESSNSHIYTRETNEIVGKSKTEETQETAPESVDEVKRFAQLAASSISKFIRDKVAEASS